MSATGETHFSGLLDAEERHRADPDSFSIPRSDVRTTLESGDVVKLLFGFGGGGSSPAERMWVTVTAVDGEGYVGRLENRPEVITDLSPGARVEFGADRVAAIYRDPDPAPRPELFVVVSERIWSGPSRPQRAIHAHPLDPTYSGWQVFSAEDRDDVPSDMARFVSVTHEALVNRYRSFDSIESEPPGTRWQWDHDALEWRRDAERS